MAVAVEFKDWLDIKLRELNTDENIFGSYIQGILDGDDSSEEKSEALQGIISEIMENDVEITKLCEEILEKWHLNKSKEPPPAIASSEEINEKLAKLLECQLPTTKQKQYTEEEKKIREAILSQYSQMTDSEEEDDDPGAKVGDTTGAKEKGGSIEKNVNAQLVADAEKQKREHAKVESQKKREKDREDREKQKNLKEEKKEKRKTQKGERRR